MLLPPSALPGISPSRGEIGKKHRRSPHFTERYSGINALEMGEALQHPISPLEGEMPGRAEGGVAIGKTL
ncbi:hypothetical protein LCM4573_03205 [Rhizobium sp. LCM 4573]|nr:hypothetical protein LCM4573_03205 [Rhizobium sp. LCM 4573]